MYMRIRINHRAIRFIRVRTSGREFYMRLLVNGLAVLFLNEERGRLRRNQQGNVFSVSPPSG